MHNGLLVRHRLKSRIPNVVDECPRYGDLVETVIHCLNQCPFASEVWRLTDSHGLTAPDGSSTFWYWWLRVMQGLKRKPNYRSSSSIFSAVLWKLWNERNLRIFEGVTNSLDSVVSAAKELIREYHQFHPP
ncbi:hypothetical protein PIB30_117069 [Stylosanthes scabra]|uniref:Reverse transcriptase zinc-binding domain-containing protein n=1 Tax=Stylosanthes scabra TaxID=79078 RepID=A0ABU6XAE3_9FABA|nr:hypothetical protein [Stylosanthes scabra]